jgi:TolA-binding protein
MIRNTLALVIVLFLPAQTTAGDFERGVEAFYNKDYDTAIVRFNAHLREHPKETPS